MTKSMLAGWSTAALLLLAAGACGGDDGASSDAGAGNDGAPPVDAFNADAAVVDCEADHRESHDGGNDVFGGDGAAEDSGQTLTSNGDPFTLCGQMDPAQTTATLVDADAYAFEVGGVLASSVRIEMSAPEGASLDDLTMWLYQAGEGPPVELSKGVFRNDYALVVAPHLEPGLYWIGVTARVPLPDAPVGYTITVSHNTFECPTAGGAPNYTESGDGGGRGNDVVAIHYPDPPALTAVGTDDPEDMSQTLAPGEVVLVRGISAALSSDDDSYLDRDTYLVQTGANTTELEVRLSWPDPFEGDGADLDLYLFAADDLEDEFSMRLGAIAGDTDDETFTLDVDPSRSYWLWVGAFDDTDQGGGGALPVTYDLTLCSRAHGAPRRR